MAISWNMASPASHPVPFRMFSGTLLEACSQTKVLASLFDCPMCLIHLASTVELASRCHTGLYNSSGSVRRGQTRHMFPTSYWSPQAADQGAGLMQIRQFCFSASRCGRKSESGSLETRRRERGERTIDGHKRPLCDRGDPRFGISSGLFLGHGRRGCGRVGLE